MQQIPTDNALNLSDLNTMIAIIDLAAERGSLKGNELLVVGTLREKIAVVVQNASTLQSIQENQIDDNTVV